MCESAELSPSIGLLKMRCSPRKEAFYILLWKGIRLHTSIHADHLSQHRRIPKLFLNFFTFRLCILLLLMYILT